MFEAVTFNEIGNVLSQSQEQQQKTLEELRKRNNPLKEPNKSGYCLCAYQWKDGNRIIVALLEYRAGDGFYLGTTRLVKGRNVDYLEVLDYNDLNK